MVGTFRMCFLLGVILVVCSVIFKLLPFLSSEQHLVVLIVHSYARIRIRTFLNRKKGEMLWELNLFSQ